MNEEILKRIEKLQEESHDFIEQLMEASKDRVPNNKEARYNAAMNTWLFSKLAQLEHNMECLQRGNIEDML
jgi:hypothetical protein